MQHMLLGPHHNICCNLGSLLFRGPRFSEDTKVQTIITFRSFSPVSGKRRAIGKSQVAKCNNFLPVIYRNNGSGKSLAIPLSLEKLCASVMLQGLKFIFPSRRLKPTIYLPPPHLSHQPVEVSSVVLVLVGVPPMLTKPDG